MTTNAPTNAPTDTPERVRRDPMRRTAFLAGALYLITFVTSIPALALKDTVRHNAHFVLGAGSTSGVMWAGFLDVACALAGIGSALALYSVVKRTSPTSARGFVISRTVEAVVMFVGVICLFAIVTLRHDVAGTAGTSSATLVTTAKALVALHDWTFLLGPGLMAGINACFLASALFRSRLIPRLIPALGLVGAPLIIASATGTMFGAWGQTSKAGAVLGAPIFVWELSLGVWLVLKGFKPLETTTEAIVSGDARVVGGLAA